LITPLALPKPTIASTGPKKGQLKSLADSLKGKQGRFRQNLLGKRTDYRPLGHRRQSEIKFGSMRFAKRHGFGIVQPFIILN